MKWGRLCRVLTSGDRILLASKEMVLAAVLKIDHSGTRVDLLEGNVIEDGGLH